MQTLTLHIFLILQLPVLLVDDRPIAQTGSILRYIDKLSGANIEDEITAAQADSAFEAAQEMPMAQIYVAVNLMEEPEAKEAARAFKAALPKYLEHWSGNLGARKFFHGKLRNVILIEELGAPCWDVISIDYLLADEALRNVKLAIRRAGQAPGYADFYIWALLDTAKGFVPEAFKDHSSLKQWSARVKGLPAVTKYLSTRPRVRDVSKWKI